MIRTVLQAAIGVALAASTVRAQAIDPAEVLRNLNLDDAARECSESAVAARGKLRLQLGSGAPAESPLKQLIDSDLRLEEAICFTLLRNLLAAQELLGGPRATGTDALRVLEQVSSDLAARRAELTDAQRDVESARAEAEQLNQQNLQATLAMLARTGFFAAKSPDAIIRDYAADKGNYVDVGGVTLLVTPFGFFMYDQTVVLDGRRGRQRLIFQPFNPFRNQPLIEQYGAYQLARLTQFTLEPAFRVDRFDVTAPGSLTRAVNFNTPESWDWQLRRHWFRPFAQREPATLEVRGGTSKATDQIGVFDVQVESAGWLTPVWGFVGALGTAAGAIEFVKLLVAGGIWIGLWEGVKKLWQRMSAAFRLARNRSSNA